MLASRVLITAGTPDSMYLEDRQEKWLWRKGNERDEGGEGGREGRFKGGDGSSKNVKKGRMNM